MQQIELKKPYQLSINLIKKVEGCRLVAYEDSARIPTIGYGTTQYENGKKVKMGDNITIQEAEFLLIRYCKINIFDKLDRLQKFYGFNDNIYASLASFCYNLGSIKLSILEAIRSRNLDNLKNSFLKYVKAKIGPEYRIIPGLVNRRKIEIENFGESW